MNGRREFEKRMRALAEQTSISAQIKSILEAQRVSQAATIKRTFQEANTRTYAHSALAAVKDLGERIQAHWNESMPDNWRGLGFDLEEAAVDLVLETGWCLVWVPRQAIVRELLAADPDQRASVLLNRKAEILDDIEACLGESPSIGPELRAQALAAVAAYRDGHWRPAQAHGGAILTTALEQQLGFKRMRRAAEALPNDPDDVGLSLVRIATVTSCIDFASYFDPGQGPAGFSRNRSLHHANDATQYTEVNSLASLMLVAGLLREMEHWYEEDAEAE